MSNVTDNTASIDAESELLSQHDPRAATALPGPLSTALRILIFFQILLLPIFFGGVHPGIYLPLWTAAFLLGAAVMFVRPGAVMNLLSWSRHRCSVTVCAALAAILLYSAIRFAWLQRIAASHPILGLTGSHPDPIWFFTSWRELAYALTTFVLVRIFLGASRSRAHLVGQLVVIAGFVVSFIALAHWFYDNGRLFWIFEPESVFVVERARWPFVNSNHLGDYLTISFFLLLSLTAVGFRGVLELRHSRGRRRMQSLAMLVTSDRFVHRVIRPLSLTVPLLCVGLSIVACLSRGAWLGTSVGLILYLVLGRFGQRDENEESPSDAARVIPFSTEAAPADGGPRSKKRRRRTRSFRDSEWYLKLLGIVPQLMKPALVVAAVLLLLFFLNERGRQLFAERIDYGLAHSIDDMRWTFYNDSMPILEEHLYFGAGLGAWLSLYRRYEDPGLAGLNPGYLHSDPLQLLIELGVVGCLPLIFLICVLFRESVAAIRRAADPDYALRLSAMVCGLTALAVSSLPEFPFRVPAITTLTVILLALTSFYVENCERKQ